MLPTLQHPLALSSPVKPGFKVCRKLPPLQARAFYSQLLVVLIVGAAVFLHYGCSREKQPEQSAAVMIEELLLSAPQDSFILGALRFNGPAYFKSLQHASPEPISVASLASQDNTTAQAAQLAEILKKSSLFPSIDKPNDGLAVGIIFASGSQDKLELGAVGKGTNIDSHINTLVEALRSQGTNITEESSLKTPPLTFAYSFTVNSAAASPGSANPSSAGKTSTQTSNGAQESKVQKFFVLGKNDQISLSTSPEVARRPFEKITTPVNLLSKADVKAFFDKMGNDESALAYGYANVQAITSAAGQPATATGVDAVRFSRSVNETPQDTIGIILGADVPPSMLQYLVTSSDTSLFKYSPTPSVITIGLGQSIISGLQAQATAVANGAGGAAASIPPATLQALLGAILSLNITLDFNPGVSPFPDLIISARSNDSTALKSKVANLVKQGLASSPFKDLPWENKTIEGAEAQIVRSPMGVGLVLTATKEHVILASSETALARGIKVTDGRDSSLLSTLPAGIASKIEKDGSPITYHIDFPRLTTLLRGVAPLLGAAAGGQITLPPEALDNLSKFGALTGTLSGKGNVIEINQTYQFAKK